MRSTLTFAPSVSRPNRALQLTGAPKRLSAYHDLLIVGARSHIEPAARG